MMIRSSLLLAILGLVGIGAFPVPAAACILNPLHNFSPWPPCTPDDLPNENRLSQTNQRIAGKLLIAAGKIVEIKSEIRGWQTAYGQALAFEQDLKSVYGQVTAHPVPSLVHEFNRTRPLGRYVRLEFDENMQIGVNTWDIRTVADSIKANFEANLEQIYSPGLRSAERLESHVFNRGAMIEREILAVRDFQRYSAQVIDSLHASGSRTADRYVGMATADGVAEAHISQLSATLNRLRGTAFDAQVRSLESRLQVLESSQANANALRRHNRQIMSLTF